MYDGASTSARTLGKHTCVPQLWQFTAGLSVKSLLILLSYG